MSDAVWRSQGEPDTLHKFRLRQDTRRDVLVRCPLDALKTFGESATQKLAVISEDNGPAEKSERVIVL